MLAVFRVHGRRAGGFVLVLAGFLFWMPTQSRPVEVAYAVAPTASTLWLAPATASSGKSAFATAVDELAAGQAAVALPEFTRAARDPELGGYGLLYQGRAQLALSKTSEAAATSERLLALHPAGYLGAAALWLSADAAEGAGNWTKAIADLQTLASSRLLDPARVSLRLGHVALKAEDRQLAASAFTKVYYDFPLADEASDAGEELAKLVSGVPPTHDDLIRDLARAQTLYGARRYTDARSAFSALRAQAAGDDRQLVDMRIGACDYGLKHYTAARDELKAVADTASPSAVEAQFLYLSTLRELDRHDEYVSLARAFVDAHPTDPLAEETLNDLATYYVHSDDDATAASVLSELYTRFPSGPHADRAAWRSGWWAYKAGNYAETIRTFESAAVTFSRSDYRPSWLYWAARAHLKRSERDLALAGFRQVVDAYRNSYYGRAAVRAIQQAVPDVGQVSPVTNELPPTILPGTPPLTAPTIRALLGAGLYDDAILEVRKAQLDFGTSPLLEATIAYALNRKGELRPAITAMRRAYPQFLSAGGESLPNEVLRVIFPLAYWDLISKYATPRDLDPYVVAALVAQESTFQADVKSSAGAWGLMQIEPSTGRQYASKLGIRPFTTRRLTQPDVNVQIGTASFADRLARFGTLPAALAAYNAGDSRVVRWLADRPGFDQEEFIDDIPFPETQNYVKRVLGTAEDYRSLYQGGRVETLPASRIAAAKPSSTSKAAPAKSSTKKPAAKKKTATKKRNG
jgi:soluble lytic murein transglycosylase